MFFDPLWMYLKALAVTVVVETGMFALIISKKPLKITAAACFNILSHILLHLFFTLMVRTSFGYNIWVYIAGEVMVVLFEAVLYRLSSLIPNFKKALLWSFVFNVASIAIGQLINLLL
jgi:hypothetical protein